MTHRVAFIGLGVMGAPMAGYLATHGHHVTVFNRTRAKSDAWLAENDEGPGTTHRVAASPRDAVSSASFVFSCVGRDADLREIAFGEDGLLSGVMPGAVWVDHTSASAEIAVELAEAMRERGGFFLDAPVSGGQIGAETGALSVMAGGEAEVLARAKPLIDCYAKTVRLMGGHGSGQLAKMVNQICIAGLLQALAEGLAFAQTAGLDPARVLEVVGKGAAQSWQMDHRAAAMIEGKFDFGFAVDLMRKDLALCLDAARRCGVSLPATALVDQFYAEVQAMGGGRWDTSSLIARLGKSR